MANNYGELPRVNFSVDLGNFEEARRAAQALEEAGMTGAMAEFENNYRRAIAGSKAFIRKAGADEVEEAAKLERRQVGHSKSGYEPTGTLEGSITPQFKDGGLSVSVVPLATAEDAEKARKAIKEGKKKVRRINKPSKKKDVYYYGAAVEFGKGNNPKEPFMKPSGELVSTKLDGKFDEVMRHAIR